MYLYLYISLYIYIYVYTHISEISSRKRDVFFKCSLSFSTSVLRLYQKTNYWKPEPVFINFSLLCVLGTFHTWRDHELLVRQVPSVDGLLPIMKGPCVIAWLFSSLGWWRLAQPETDSSLCQRAEHPVISYKGESQAHSHCKGTV